MEKKHSLFYRFFIYGIFSCSASKTTEPRRRTALIFDHDNNALLSSFLFQLLRFPPGEALIVPLDVSAGVLRTPTTDTTPRIHKVGTIRVPASLQQPHKNPSLSFFWVHILMKWIPSCASFKRAAFSLVYGALLCVYDKKKKNINWTKQPL